MRSLLDSQTTVLQGLLLLLHSLSRLAAMAQSYDDYYDNRPDEVPYFLPGPTNMSVHKGDTAVLKCGIQNLGTKTVIWRRASDPNPLTIGQSVYVGDGRYTAEANKENNEWRLLIRDVQSEDAGVYECQISSKIKRIHHILLRVNVTARPERKNYDSFVQEEAPTAAVVTKLGRKDITVTGPKFVEKGDPIHLVCNATGSLGPPRNLDWFKDGIKLTPDGVRQIQIDKFSVMATRTLVSVLDVKHSRMGDAGTYVCRSDLSITSTKVHVLNAGSINVRRGTSATGTKGNNQDKSNAKGGYKEEERGGWEANESSSSSSSSNNDDGGGDGEVIGKQTGTQTENTGNSSNVSVPTSYSPVMVTVMLTIALLISTWNMQHSSLALPCR